MHLFSYAAKDKARHVSAYVRFGLAKNFFIGLVLFDACVDKMRKEHEWSKTYLVQIYFAFATGQDNLVRG